MRQISRDPFARTTLMRRTVPNVPGGCTECGNTNADGKLFEYRTESDGGATKGWHPGKFCSKSCFDAYNG